MDSETFNDIFGPNSWDNNRTIFHAIAASDMDNVFVRIFENYDDREDLKSILRLKNKDGDTCLHTAAKEQNGIQAGTLISRMTAMGAELDAQNNEGDTVLHIAVKKEDHELVEELLDIRVNKDLKNTDGLTAYEIAQKMDDQKSMELISNARYDSA